MAKLSKKKGVKPDYYKAKPNTPTMTGVALADSKIKRGKLMWNLENAANLKPIGSDCDRKYQQCLIKNYQYNPCYWQLNNSQVVWKCGVSLFRDPDYKKIRTFWFKKIYPCEKAISKCYLEKVEHPKIHKIPMEDFRETIKNPLKAKPDAPPAGFLRIVDPDNSLRVRQLAKDAKQDRHFIKDSPQYTLYHVLNVATGKILDWVSRMARSLSPHPMKPPKPKAKASI